MLPTFQNTEIETPVTLKEVRQYIYCDVFALCMAPPPLPEVFHHAVQQWHDVGKMPSRTNGPRMGAKEDWPPPAEGGATVRKWHGKCKPTRRCLVARQWHDASETSSGITRPAVFLHVVPSRAEVSRAEPSRAEPSQSTLVAKEQ
jgi:hypothetical protein